MELCLEKQALTKEFHPLSLNDFIEKRRIYILSTQNRIVCTRLEGLYQKMAASSDPVLALVLRIFIKQQNLKSIEIVNSFCSQMVNTNILYRDLPCCMA